MSFSTWAQQTTVFDVARKGTLAEMKALYDADPAITSQLNESKANALILAAYRGNRDVALFLCDKTADLNYNCGRGTALMAAVMGSDIEIVKALIARHVNLDTTDDDGKTALMYAAFFNKNDIARLLIKSGADKTQKDHEGRTALDVARFNQNTELIILLDTSKS
ncbi:MULTISPECIES: ankyrin repeat domain-containing protein [unclassified Flavobacterium]|uniref:ankyrin repeat domain-containing protein n=1 Tax=unclassified Flavobacterium TaxID=196869 RepID=UPI001F144966|nr:MULTISPECIES: ankyrin repeat domain-containing protein [unclassified Flavobacterium]UMY66236.1 ankyrin repeat domain-containing protein [Flavobacterium sp. HJ-32-4]